MASPAVRAVLAVASGDGAVVTMSLPSGNGDGGAEHGRAAVADPQYLAAYPGGGTLYVASAAGEGTLVALRAGPDGELDVAGESPAGGGTPCHLAVSPDGRYLLAACYGDGTVSVHALDRDGALGACTGVATLPAPRRAADPERQDGAHPHQVCFDPAGRLVLVCDLGGDRVWAFRLDGDTGRLERVGSTMLPPGCGPRHLAFVATGPGAPAEVHVACELDSTVLRCGYVPRTGALRPLGLSAASQRRTGPAQPGAAGGVVRNYPGAIAAARRHRLSYVTNRGHDTVATAGLAVTPPAGLAGPGGGLGAAFTVTETACGGAWPLDLAILEGAPPADPVLGDSVLVANRDSGSIARFALDPHTGAIGALTGVLAIPAPVCLRPITLPR